MNNRNIISIMDFSIIIPTYKRVNDLNRCLGSLLEQTLIPEEIIVIDDDSLEPNVIEELKTNCKLKNINFTYYRKDHTEERQGLAESKNIGLTLAKSNIVFILDDDVVLEPDFCQTIMVDWNKYKDENLAGVGGFIKNRRRQSSLELFYNKIFGLSSAIHWDINSLGFQVWDNGIKSSQISYYVHGGLASYNVELVKKLKFKTFAGGRTANEDVDFCLRAKKLGYHFIIDPTAEAIHNQTKTSRESEYKTGIKESKNRKDIFYSECNSNLINRIKFYWANVGWILRQFLAFHWQRGYGLITGLFK